MSKKYDVSVTIDGVNMIALLNRIGGAETALGILRDDFVITPFDYTVRVDRRTRPDYSTLPGGAAILDNRASELWGPEEYDIRGLEKYDFTYSQPARPLSLKEIYYHYSDNARMLFLNLQDALAIQARGVAFFRKAFGLEKTVFFFGSVVHTKDGLIRVPCLNYGDGKIHLFCDVITAEWNPEHHIALRRKQ